MRRIISKHGIRRVRWPYVRNVFVRDIWNKDQNLDHIPCLETMGEYEATNTWSDEGLKEQQEHPLLLLTGNNFVRPFLLLR